jgi:hypothetical protein
VAETEQDICAACAGSGQAVLAPGGKAGGRLSIWGEVSFTNSSSMPLAIPCLACGGSGRVADDPVAPPKLGSVPPALQAVMPEVL